MLKTSITQDKISFESAPWGTCLSCCAGPHRMQQEVNDKLCLELGPPNYSFALRENSSSTWVCRINT